MRGRAKGMFQRILLTSNTPKPHCEIILHFSQRSVAGAGTHFAQHDTYISAFRKKQHTLSNEKNSKPCEKTFTTKVSAQLSWVQLG